VTESDEQPTVYVGRPSDRVANQIEAGHQRQEQQSGPAVADTWEDALMDAIASLATLPERCSVARGNWFIDRHAEAQCGASYSALMRLMW